MALIKEKEACIHLLQGPPDSIKEKVEELVRQKEQLKHKLLTQDVVPFSTSEGGLYLGNAWQNLENLSNNMDSNKYVPQNAQSIHNSNSQHLYHSSLASAILPASNFGVNTGNSVLNNSSYHPFHNNSSIYGTAPINITVPSTNLGYGASAPASLTFRKDDYDDDGIWA